MTTDFRTKSLRCRALTLALAALCIVGATGAGLTAPIQIAVTGDSNVAGKGVSSSETYPVQLEHALKAKGYDVRVLNTGVNGDTATGLLGRLASAVPEGTQIAIVWIGINDVRRQGKSVSFVQEMRRKITANLRARGIEVLNLKRDAGTGVRSDPKFTTGDRDMHFNAAGYARVVALTLPQVEGLIRKVGRGRR
jgi:lysophospholipase L1-like esterase